MSEIKSVWRSLPSRDKVKLFLLASFRIASNLLDLAGLFALTLLVASATGADKTSSVYSNLVGNWLLESGANRPLEIATWIALLFVSKSLFSAVIARISTVYLARLETEFATEILESQFGTSIEKLERLSRGDLHYAVTQSSHHAFFTIPYYTISLVAETSLLTLVIVFFFVVSPQTAVFVSAYFVVLVFSFQLVVNRRLKRVGQRLAEASSEFSDRLLATIAAFREIAVLERRHYFVNQLNSQRRILAQESALTRFLSGLPRYLVETALVVGFLGLLFLQQQPGSVEDSTVATSSFLVGGVRLIGTLLPIQNALAELRQNGPQANIALTLLRGSGQISLDNPLLGPTNTHLTDRKLQPLASIVAKGLEFRHEGSSQPALNKLDLSIKPGEFAALIGPSGAGKSTLVEILMGLRRPDSGGVKIAGIDPTIFRTRYPGGIAYVPQRIEILPGSLAANVAIGIPEGEIREGDVAELLRLVGLEDLITRSALGIHQKVGRNSQSLSGGQAQRVGLARALYSKPSVLILDEATSALDSDSENQINRVISGLKGATTVVAIAHKLSTARAADRVIVMNQGEIISEGVFEKVVTEVPLVASWIRREKE